MPIMKILYLVQVFIYQTDKVLINQGFSSDCNAVCLINKVFWFVSSGQCLGSCYYHLFCGSFSNTCLF